MKTILIIALLAAPVPALAFCPTMGTTNDGYWNCRDAEEAAKVRELELRSEMNERIETMQRKLDFEESLRMKRETADELDQVAREREYGR